MSNAAGRSALTNGRLQLGFAALVALLLVVQAGGPLRLVYPAVAVAIGFRLLTTSTADYVSFIIWLWALSPFVRRVADFQAGWQDPSLVLLTPYLVTSCCVIQVVARALLFPSTFRVSQLPGSSMFLLAGLGAVSGIPLGLVAHNQGATLEILNWIVPLGFGCYIASRVEELAQLERAVVSTFGKVAIVVGGYGVYQFFSMPGWDANWMLNSGMRSIGFAEAFAVRVFSTLHSPGVLGYYLIPPLVLWLAKPGAGGLLSVCLASVVLLLSQVRTAWLGFAISAILVLPSLRLATGARAVLLVLFGGLCVVPFLQLPEVSDKVSARIESLRDLPSYDQSAVSRIEGHARVLGFIAANPLGAGLGASPPEIEQSVGMRDSIGIAGLVQFGILGMVLYGLGLCILIDRFVRYYRSATSPEALGLACVGLGMLGTAGLGIPTAGPPGMVLWLIGGLATASVMGRHATVASLRPAWTTIDQEHLVARVPAPAGGVRAEA